MMAAAADVIEGPRIDQNKPADLREDSATDQNEIKEEVKGPAGTYLSIEEANDQYMRQNFPRWDDESCSQPAAVFWPNSFEVNKWWYPEDGANPSVSYSGPPGSTAKHISADVLGQQAEEEVLNAFREHFKDEPMFVFHSFKFQKLLLHGTKELSLNMKTAKAPKSEKPNDQFWNRESDVIIVHRKYGIILVEIKSGCKFTDSTARDQLSKIEKGLLDEQYFGLDCKTKVIIKKVIAFPYASINAAEVKHRDYIVLCKNDLSTKDGFKQWWRDKIIEKKEKMQILCKEAYKLVPKLLCGRNDVSVVHTVIRLKEQRFLKKLMNEKTVLDIKKAKKQKRDVTKTESTEGMFEVENVCSTTDIAGEESIIRTKVKWLYLTQEQSEVWNKMKQLICGPFGSGKTVLIQCKAAELAQSGEKVMVIVPHHLLAMYTKFFRDNSVHNDIKLHSFEDIFAMKFDYNEMEKCCVFVDELLWPYVHLSESMCDSMTKDDDAMARDKAPGVVNSLAEIHSKNDSPIAIKLTKRYVAFLDKLSQLFLINTMFLWVSAHSYGAVWHHMNSFLPIVSNSVVTNFITMFNNEAFVSKLTTNMRTTRHIHDLKNKQEWQAFCNISLESKKLILQEKMLHTAFYSYLGHSIPGPAHDVMEHPGAEVDGFLQYCAKEIKSKLPQLLQRSVIKKDSTVQQKLLFKCEDVAIICHSDERDKEIVEKLTKLLNPSFDLCSVAEQQDTKAVVICYSSEIASLEWPVVFHVRFNQLFTTEKPEDYGIVTGQDTLLSMHPFFASDHSMITSRCIAHYFLICRKDVDAESLYPELKFNYVLNINQKEIKDIPALLRANVDTENKKHQDSLQHLGWSGKSICDLPTSNYVMTYGTSRT